MLNARIVWTLVGLVMALAVAAVVDKSRAFAFYSDRELTDWPYGLMAQKDDVSVVAESEVEAIDVAPFKMPRGSAGNYIAAIHAANINDFKNALALYRKTQVNNVDDLTIIEKLIIYAMIQGQFREALQHTDKIISIIDTHGISRMLRLAEAVRLSKFDEALEEVEALINRGEGELLPSILKGWIYLGQGRIEEALTQVRSVPSEGMASVIQDYNAALIADVGGWPMVANARYKAAFNNRFAGQRIGEAYINFLLRQGNMALARTIRDSFEERFEGAFVEALNNDFMKGQDVTPLITNASDGVAEVFFDIGAIHFSEDNYTYSAFYNRITRHLSPTLDRAAVREADINLLISESSDVNVTDDAIAIYQLIKPDSPYYHHAQSQVGSAYLLSDKKELAEAHFTSLLEKFPKRTASFLQFAAFLSREERFDEAANILLKRIKGLDEVDESHAQLFFRAGAAFERAKKWEQAEQMLQTALKLDPDNGLILNYLGYSWVDRGENLTIALQMIEQAVELRPSDGFIIDSLGWAYYRLKRFHLAVIYLEEALSRTAGDPHIQDHLGDAYWRVGRYDEARFQWSHALELSPEPALETQIKLKIRDGLLLTSADDDPPLPIPPSPRSEVFMH